MKAVYLMVVVALAGCARHEQLDQCLRQTLFERCMASLPAGPVATQYNDWAELVESCEGQSTRSAYRAPEHVKAECRGYL